MLLVVCVGIVSLCLELLLLRAGPCLSEEAVPSTLPESVLEAQRLSGRADVLASQSHDREAAQLYFQAHVKLQAVVEELFKIGLRTSVRDKEKVEDTFVHTDRVVAELRDINLTKLWVVLDPEDRAYERMLEDERTELLQRFPEFNSPLSDEPLQEFFLRLYPENAGGSHQLEMLREGRLPSSARWARLENRKTSE